MDLVVKAHVPARYKRVGRRAFLRLAALANAGSRVECPCCGRRFRHFARFHGMHDQCPGCGALMRHRTLLLLLRDELRVASRRHDVLQVAPAASVRDWLRALPDVRLLSVDLDSSAAELRADVTELPLEGASFDLILCLHVLEHVPDDRAAMQELFRVLRTGGRAVIQVPPSPLAETFEDPSVTTPEERQRVFGQYDHVRICGADYGRRLEEAGFDVEEVDFVERLELETRSRYGLRTGEPFYLCAKAG